LARCALEPRRAVYLLQVAGRCFLVGVGEGPMSLIAELDPATVSSEMGQGAAESAGARFVEVLAHFRRRAKP
jgi:flagellar biogenesis protein FliO